MFSSGCYSLKRNERLNPISHLILGVLLFGAMRVHFEMIGDTVRSLLFRIRATGCRAHGSRQDIGAPGGGGDGSGLERQAAKPLRKSRDGIWPTERVHPARCRQADILSAVCSLESGRQDVARTVADRISALRFGTAALCSGSWRRWKWFGAPSRQAAKEK